MRRRIVAGGIARLKGGRPDIATHESPLAKENAFGGCGARALTTLGLVKGSHPGRGWSLGCFLQERSKLTLCTYLLPGKQRDVRDVTLTDPLPEPSRRQFHKRDVGGMLKGCW
jgi:hypothetical protein